MDCPSPRSDTLSATLIWIEQQLDRPLCVERIAVRAGLSPYHFSRLFSARTGHGVMAHVRARRLLRAARRLTDEPRLRLLELALASGFESQQAFTRAFKRLFGVAPGRFRRGFDLTPIESHYPMSLPPLPAADLSRLPDVRLDAFELAGFSRQFDADNKSGIPQLWARLIGSLPLAAQLPSPDSYGVIRSVDRAAGSFRYMAAVAVKPGAALPAGFERLAIAAARYAVFRIRLNGGPLHPQIRAAMATIWGELIPAAGLKLAGLPDFERYDGRFAPDQPGASIDYHVPLAG